MDSLEERLAKVSAAEYQKILYDRVTAAIAAYVADRNRWLDGIVEVCEQRNLYNDIAVEINKYNNEILKLDIQIAELIQLRRSLW